MGEARSSAAARSAGLLGVSGPRSGQRGFTLIELVIAVGIAALATAAVISSINNITSASLHTSALRIAGAIKLNYDRAIMQHRTQRLAMDIDKGVIWVEYTESPFALSRERDLGKAGLTKEELADQAQLGAAGAAGSAHGRSPSGPGPGGSGLAAGLTGDKQKDAFILEAGRAASFTADADIDLGKPAPLPKSIHFGKVWTGHQEEPFTSGIAFLHFFPTGFTEPAIIELVDESEEIVSIKVEPLTGRVRTYDHRVEPPKVEADDGRKEGDL
jgi:prepilin-type N-terminal cleavage/methylation domain-containing protein